MDVNDITASKIREIRKSLGYSAEAIAADLQISKAAYSQLENGKVEITIPRLHTLATIFKVPIEVFIPHNNHAQTIQIANGEKAQNIQHQINHSDNMEIIKQMNGTIKVLEDLVMKIKMNLKED